MKQTSRWAKTTFWHPTVLSTPKDFSFSKKILLLAFCISVTEAKVIHEAWSLPEDISMKRYCREGKKCSIEAAIECGPIYALDCGMPCTLQLQLALCTSAVNLFTVMHTLCFTYLYILCVERGAAWKHLRRRRGVGGSRSHLGEDEKSASPATVTKKLLHQ